MVISPWRLPDGPDPALGAAACRSKLPPPGATMARTICHDNKARNPMTEAFDPSQHSFGPAKYFDDLAIGDTFYIPSRTMTDALFAAFQLASGDNHPIHYDREYCARRNHPNLLAHGLQVLVQTAAGAGIFPHVIGDALIAFVEVSGRMLKPVYAGDTLYPLLRITELTPQRSTGVVVMRATVHNQKGELALDGMHKYLLRKRPAAA